MSFLTTFLILYFLCVLYVKTQTINYEAKLACEPFDNDEDGCNSYTFTLSGYGSSGCTYVPLTSLDSENTESVCLPDHCGLFEDNQQRCEDDIYCSWEPDYNNERSTVHRCYPVCFNKLDIMFLVDGSTSRTSDENDEGKTPFEVNLEAIRDFVEDNIPEYGTTNDVYETREYILSFAGRADSADFEFDSTLNFTLSESLDQSEIEDHILDLQGVGSNTNLRAALTESYTLFLEDTKSDHQRVLIIFSDGSPTESTYLEEDFPELGYLDHDLKRELGYIGCYDEENNQDRCQPFQYYDLATFLWDPLNVYYLWVLLGEEIQTFASGTSNGPLFAADFTVDDTTDLIEITDDNFQPFLDSISASSLSRPIDASVCSRKTSAPTAITSAPTTNPTTFSVPGLGDTSINSISDTDAPTLVPTNNPTPSPTTQIYHIVTNEYNACTSKCDICTGDQTQCQNCCDNRYNNNVNRDTIDDYQVLFDRFDRCYDNNCN